MVESLRDSRRLIPARAGNTRVPRIVSMILTAHPRSRGEHCAGGAKQGFGGGSSPLARGTLARCVCLLARLRLIPARAGNTRCAGVPFLAFPAHPRSRGEHRPTDTHFKHPSGSSPLARGTRQCLKVLPTGTRLIPARAGNTPTNTQRAPPAAAHPRSRGEHYSNDALMMRSFGSSPLARGTPVSMWQGWVHTRLIPARAGNTWHGARGDFGASAHPRSRGEHVRFSSRFRFVCGSSPLARGTLGWEQVLARVCRLIPARAGNTAASSSREM